MIILSSLYCDKCEVELRILLFIELVLKEKLFCTLKLVCLVSGSRIICRRLTFLPIFGRITCRKFAPCIVLRVVLTILINKKIYYFYLFYDKFFFLKTFVCSNI